MLIENGLIQVCYYHYNYRRQSLICKSMVCLLFIDFITISSGSVATLLI